MRISEFYELGRQQPTLDFVDVHVEGDSVLFIDPRALHLLRSEWADECISLIQNFFGEVLRAIHEGRDPDAQRMLNSLKEPNETRLGFSSNEPRGRALGATTSHDVWNALRDSEAVKSGLLEDLEDTILMVEGIASDIVSDIVTNIIRQPLTEYTQYCAEFYGIPLIKDVASGPLWDPEKLDWYAEFVQLPIAAERKLLLVPKAIIRLNMDYDSDEYFRHYILPALQRSEISASTDLVRLLKDGSPRVTKKDLIEKYGQGKHVSIQQTQLHPEILTKYRTDKRQRIRPPLSHEEIAEIQGTEPPNWAQLLIAVHGVLPGKEQSTEYEQAIEKLLSSLFYPYLTNPIVQHEIHDGRKRIDITYTNMATAGFFGWLAKNYSASHVFVECKNYSDDISNPELDQMAGRFSPSRGQFGLIICRKFEDKDLFIKRCRDTAMDSRGFIIPLDDGDLKMLVNSKPDYTGYKDFVLLEENFRKLIM